ncbi:MAG: 2'-5' RNA ligase family protein [Anaerolineales bacterium]|nr:2'-5' RNA ligase family protein [Anaerolineales bacterium]
MHGLVSLLPEPYYNQVQAIWEELAGGYGLQGVRVTPYPHFSWQIAQDYDFERLEEIVRGIARASPPLAVRTAGLALFTGFRPVLYVPVVKDALLLELHAHIWRSAQPASQGLSPYYAPDAWMPHISLAYEDVNRENIGPLIESLAFRSFNWEMTIDNIALIYEPKGEIGALKFCIQFSG